jgi:hypothetical protein
MKKFKVTIKANELFPYYMQHKMSDTKLEEWEKSRGRIIERDDVSKEDISRAMFHAYMTDKNKYYMPSEHIRSALIEAGKYIKAKVGNANRNMSNIVAGMFYILEEQIPLPDDFLVDKRSAVNQNVKARIITIRPKWKNWKASFTLAVDNDTLTNETIKKIVEFAGSYVGIGSYRPINKGQFGRFDIETFEPIEA